MQCVNQFQFHFPFETHNGFGFTPGTRYFEYDTSGNFPRIVLVFARLWHILYYVILLFNFLKKKENGGEGSPLMKETLQMAKKTSDHQAGSMRTEDGKNAPADPTVSPSEDGSKYSPTDLTVSLWEEDDNLMKMNLLFIPSLLLSCLLDQECHQCVIKNNLLHLNKKSLLELSIVIHSENF
ncbi:hypothetical protein ROHU_024550 [Labeo rohita]|uniref:Uncharacterized protein n=1 Tax=Labeo rohita TaxID=84645 RepID=A0A498MI65_LABRO|nr:hypothetical protein ROHU_024550 [Labeo rohita]